YRSWICVTHQYVCFDRRPCISRGEDRVQVSWARRRAASSPKVQLWRPIVSDSLATAGGPAMKSIRLNIRALAFDGKTPLPAGGRITYNSSTKSHELGGSPLAKYGLLRMKDLIDHDVIA